MRYLLVALAALPLLAACSTAPEAKSPPAAGQSLPQALTMMCDVDRLAGVVPETDALGAGGKRTAWLSDHVENPDAIELKTLMSVKGPPEQARMLRACATEAGVLKCALADVLEKSELGGLSP